MLCPRLLRGFFSILFHSAPACAALSRFRGYQIIAMRTQLVVSLLTLFAGHALAEAQQPHGEEDKKSMGPAAFMWPPDRFWDPRYDNTAPCGSNAGPTNRTDFPRRKTLILNLQSP